MKNLVLVILYKYYKIFLFAVFFIFVQLFSPSFSKGEDAFLNKNYVGHSNLKSPYAAKKEILNRAIKYISKEIIVEMIGEERYRQNQSLIDVKIIKFYSKYIPLLNQKDTLKVGDRYKSTVKLSFSTKTLKAMLLKEGLLYEGDHVPIILPMVTFHIEKEVPFQWWMESNVEPEMGKYVHSFHSILQKAFFEKGFYSFRPYFFCFFCSVPILRSTSFLYSQEIKQFASLFNSELVLIGSVYIKPPSNRKKGTYLLDWQARQAKDNKTLVRLKEQKEISLDSLGSSSSLFAFKSFIQEASTRMTQRVLLLWQQGRLGIETLELKLFYPVSIRDNAKIKSILSQIKGVKSFSEYKMDSHSMSYLIYVNSSAEFIARKLSFLESSYFKGKISYYKNQIRVQR